MNPIMWTSNRCLAMFGRSDCHDRAGDIETRNRVLGLAQPGSHQTELSNRRSTIVAFVSFFPWSP